MKSPEKPLIDKWDLLLVRECKRSRETSRLVRVYAKSRALAPSACDRNDVVYGLMEIIDKLKLVPNTYDFIAAIQRNMRCYQISFEEAYFDMARSIIANTEVSVFPHYPRPAWFRNKYGKDNKYNPDGTQSDLQD